MRIVAKGKGIPKWSNVKGDMIIDDTHGKFWLKLDTDDYKHQYIVEFEPWELKDLKRVLKKKVK